MFGLRKDETCVKYDSPTDLVTTVSTTQPTVDRSWWVTATYLLPADIHWETNMLILHRSADEDSAWQQRHAAS
ncbi:hypothetical protein O3P69_001656 [Scylla paramamosain]|uniref:Uncharacterized protein n=1 Tax=Scylla paramamosain TaxID=85552 RepID=A0AAW0UYP6_SCYPA